MREGRQNPLCAQCTLCALIFVQAIDLAELCYNSRAHHAVRVELRFSGLSSNGAEVAGLRARGRSLRMAYWGSKLCLCRAKSRFPENRDRCVGDSVRMGVMAMRGEGTPDIFVHLETLRRFGMTELR